MWLGNSGGKAGGQDLCPLMNGQQNESQTLVNHRVMCNSSLQKIKASIYDLTQDSLRQHLWVEAWRSGILSSTDNLDAPRLKTMNQLERQPDGRGLYLWWCLFFFLNFDCTGSSLQYAGSLVVLGGFSYPVECGILGSPPRDWTCFPCIGRWILNHWTTMEVPLLVLLVSTWESPEFSDFEKSIVLNLAYFFI